MVPSWFEPERFAALDRWLLPDDETQPPAPVDPKEAAWKAWVVMIAAPLLLTWQHYGFSSAGIEWIAQALGFCGYSGLLDWLHRPAFTFQDTHLVHLLGWSLGCLITGLFLPMLIVAVLFRESPLDYGLKANVSGRESLLALVFLLVMAPIVYFMSGNASFQASYPFYRLQLGEPLWPRWHVWEFGYGLQFVAVEFFFRGFLVHGLRPQFGGYAVPIMTIPYCLIHFGKPWQETCAAVLAGLALGWLSLRTRSIWWGVLLHVSVAWSMDTLSLWRTGHFSPGT